MSALTEERSQLEEKVKSLEARLLRLQQVEGIEDHVLAFVEKIRDKVDVLDEAGRRRVLELVFEDVTCHSDHAIIRTVIPPLYREPSGQLAASPQGGDRGKASHPPAGGGPDLLRLYSAAVPPQEASHA